MNAVKKFNCHILFNSTATIHARKPQCLKSTLIDRETAFPVFLSLSVYSKTRKKTLVNFINEYGLGVS